MNCVARRAFFISNAFYFWPSTMAGSKLAFSADNAANFLRKVRLELR